MQTPIHRRGLTLPCWTDRKQTPTDGSIYFMKRSRRGIFQHIHTHRLHVHFIQYMFFLFVWWYIRTWKKYVDDLPRYFIYYYYYIYTEKTLTYLSLLLCSHIVISHSHHSISRLHYHQGVCLVCLISHLSFSSSHLAYQGGGRGGLYMISVLCILLFCCIRRRWFVVV